MSAQALRLAVGTTVSVCTALALTAAAPAAAAAEGQGFPGTIKVSGVTEAPDPANQAKPGCVARVDFFNFKRDTYDVVFTATPPSGTRQVLAGRATITQPSQGGSEVQQSRRYRLDVSGLQMDGPGYKLKVEVSNPDRSGGGAKSKVFSFACVPASAGVAGGAAGGATGGAAAPAGGFQTGFGGSQGQLPLLPLSGLAAGLLLLGAGAFARSRRST